MIMKKSTLKSNKILGLEKMQELGIPVPKFSFIPDFTELDLELIDLNYYYPPKKFEKFLSLKLKQFEMSETGISIRSASFDEDESDQSSAGRYLSINGITTLQQAIDACFQIWLHHRQNSKNTHCPLIIQETHPSFFSGLCFKDKDTIIIESYYGACRNLVEGWVPPYTTIIKNNKIKNNYIENNNYSYRFITHSEIFKKISTQVGKTLTSKTSDFVKDCRLFSFINNKTICAYGYRPSCPVKSYEKKIIPQLIEIADKLDSDKGVDIEWGSEIDGKVFAYQFRTLSRKINDLDISKIYRNSNYKCSEKEFKGIPASKGFAQGILTHKIENINDNSILFLASDYLNDLSVLDRVKGIIALNGGILSHLSIMCREKNIPCIVSVNGTIQEGAQIVMNQNPGIIKLI